MIKSVYLVLLILITSVSVYRFYFLEKKIEEANQQLIIHQKLLNNSDGIIPKNQVRINRLLESRSALLSYEKFYLNNAKPNNN